MEKLKFFQDVGLSHFGRIAVVANANWVPKLMNLEGRLFKGVEMKGFPMEEKAAAIAFLKEA